MRFSKNYEFVFFLSFPRAAWERGRARRLLAGCLRFPALRGLEAFTCRQRNRGVRLYGYVILKNHLYGDLYAMRKLPIC